MLVSRLGSNNPAVGKPFIVCRQPCAASHDGTGDVGGEPGDTIIHFLSALGACSATIRPAGCVVDGDRPVIDVNRPGAPSAPACTATIDAEADFEVSVAIINARICSGSIAGC